MARGNHYQLQDATESNRPWPQVEELGFLEAMVAEMDDRSTGDVADEKRQRGEDTRGPSCHSATESSSLHRSSLHV